MKIVKKWLTPFKNIFKRKMAFSLFTLHAIHFLTNPFLNYNFNGLNKKQNYVVGETMNNFLPHSQNLFWVLKRTTQQVVFVGYSEHMFWLRYRKILRFDCLDSKKKILLLLCISQNKRFVQWAELSLQDPYFECP